MTGQMEGNQELTDVMEDHCPWKKAAPTQTETTQPLPLEDTQGGPTTPLKRATDAEPECSPSEAPSRADSTAVEVEPSNPENLAMVRNADYVKVITVLMQNINKAHSEWGRKL